MRAGWGAVLAFAATGALAAVASCVDLFHSTDFETLCELHPDACTEGGRLDAAAEAADAGPPDICKSTSTGARAAAKHACAWLGACSVPYDHNAFGACMIDALLAYDCTTNPNLAVAPGPLRDYWATLADARSCATVNGLINPKGVSCSGTGIACAPSGAGEPGTLLECVDNAGGGESCLVTSQECKGGACATPRPLSPCDKSKCDGTVLHDCVAKVDVGHDCKQLGNGTCEETDAGPQCAPTFAGGAGGPCSSTDTVSCDGGAAATCMADTAVFVDCTTLTGPGSCVPGTPKPSWNVAAQCQGSGSCKPGCNGTTLTDCAQGARFTVDCTSEGLKACRSVKLATGTGYACGAP